MLRDTRAYYGDDINLIIVMTILIVFLILVAILRAVVAPLYLIASVVISYLSALGVGVIVFQFILGQPLTWSIPGLTFIVLVAMGADYNLLLISRLREESPHGIRSGVIHTVSSTGGVITAAGVIFAASMFGMLFASISTLVQCGFIIGTGLAAGHLPRAHHHGARNCGPRRQMELVAVQAAAARAPRATGPARRGSAAQPKRRPAPRAPARPQCRHAERAGTVAIAVVNGQPGKTHSATRRVCVGVRS